MSIYSQCSEAAAKLMKNPPKDQGGVFTEIDVVRLAGSSGWSTENYKEALRHANQVVGTNYRARKLCRYGPVELPDGTKDYARIASKIVYADAENGPDVWKTPNGNFPKLMIHDDEIGRQGRRHNTNRNDLASWDEQDIKAIKVKEPVIKGAKGPAVDVGPFERRIAQLEADLNRANKLLEEKEREIQRLRDHKATPINGKGIDESRVKKLAEDAVEAFVSDLTERLSRLEDIESRRQKVYTEA